MKTICLCIPTINKPFKVTLDSIKASLPLLDKAGIEHKMVSEVGSPYISHARAAMLRKALNAGADTIVFIDHDVSWEPEDLLALVQADGDVVAGTYRFKRAIEEYMGKIFSGEDGTPLTREDGAISTHSAPAGFLKITENAVNILYQNFPELTFDGKHTPSIDLFNHGAFGGIWYGEDYAFCRRWLETENPIWTLPDLNITHHSTDKSYPGNFHNFLRRQPGGDLA